MILIDALHINVGGGKVLLDYLVKELEFLHGEVFFLFDIRCRNDYGFINEKHKVYMNPSILPRLNFYRKNRNKFSKVFCFGNMPPLIKIEAEVYTYFHQTLLLNLPKDARLPTIMKIAFLKKVIQLSRQNSNFWLVQSKLVQRRFAYTFEIKSEKILIVPFYPELEVVKKEDQKNFNFLYVSDGYPHKNHRRLIEGFSAFYRLNGKGKLTLTVSKSFPDLLDLINKKKLSGIPIENIGFVHRSRLPGLYAEHPYFIYPSLEESFGLGIVEAIEAGCKVIGSDLPYLHEVCLPSGTFDPYNLQSITNSLNAVLGKDQNETIQKIFNEIGVIKTILSDKLYHENENQEISSI